jgi:integrase
LLAAEPVASRELDATEIRALLATATEAKLAALLLLSGLSPEELMALNWDDIDLARREIRVSGGSFRTAAMLDPVYAALADRPRTPGMRLLGSTQEDLTSDLLCAAYDAGIEQPAEVTPAALRHTYISFLARQGIRLADLVKIVGRLPAEHVAFYSSYAPAGKRLPLDEVDRAIEGIDTAGGARSRG